jgi:hypothetical protein
MRFWRIPGYLSNITSQISLEINRHNLRLYGLEIIYELFQFAKREGLIDLNQQRF